MRIPTSGLAGALGMLLLLGPASAGGQQADAPYFQQGVDYRIEATLDEGAQVLRGRARLRYTNRSSSTLDTLFLHQHLNAFRPNSAWARRELRFGERRFQDLGPDEHAFERFRSVTVDGTPVGPVYPGAPDSTVAALPLPSPIPPGGSVTVVMDWEARPSTLPRRQGRRGRHWDFAQWYPRIAVFDRGGWQEHPLMPQGEFYGEFARYDVTLDVDSEQVIGATGVPVGGDPGWEGAAAVAGTQPLYRRDAYGPIPAAESLGLLSGPPAAGRKRVRFVAEDVHHFAWTTNPDYIYEGGRAGDVAIHVLYQPGDTAWDDGVVVQRTADAIAFFEEIYGDYPWPQITNVHRIESGGTEFPMLQMNGSASEGLIVHETGHMWNMGILAANEWREGWMDEGMQSFLDTWYVEEKTGVAPEQAWSRTIQGLGQYEARGLAEPLALESAEFRDFQTYAAMTYSKPSGILYMLREYVGEDVMRRALRDFYTRHKLQHVRGDDFFAAVERASGEDLDWFREQWFEGTNRLDYGIGDVNVQQDGGAWVTTVEVLRLGDAWMPVTLEVGDTTVELDSRERRQLVHVRTSARPEQAVLDPGLRLLDMDRSNNTKAL